MPTWDGYAASADPYSFTAFPRFGDGRIDAAQDKFALPRRSGSPEAVERDRVEPYVAVGDVYRLPERVGQGGWTWYTGSAAWMYRSRHIYFVVLLASLMG